MLFEEKQNMKLYPIADSYSWIVKLISWGVKTVQLRIKLDPLTENNSLQKIENEIKNSIQYCQSHNCQLFINDYWEIALKYKAFGVHLGYEDSFHADISSLHKNKIRFGLSTHDTNELNYALELNPSYIALGPIFPTKTKEMKFSPQGIEKISIWRNKIPKSIPLVAIGGIKLENAHEIYIYGADSISIIHDFMSSSCPEERIKDWLNMANNNEFK
ncbi:thiamine phosphate synthase [Silvanigrella paludirubra]|uniref:Thiamine phosphate synthase n=1 Tax=Silvanigrella paludirubra TaxID=2499159 RepID=A0A6N6VV52_9BACT|nr:thiamine phosphate synthase [Silvanigrella paludirubra]KAB8040485.1 thiamine phosphate synthase [Silvanigrella paludirubra]